MGLILTLWCGGFLDLGVLPYLGLGLGLNLFLAFAFWCGG